MEHSWGGVVCFLLSPNTLESLWHSKSELSDVIDGKEEALGEASMSLSGSYVHLGPAPDPWGWSRVGLEEASLINKLLGGGTMMDQSLPVCLIYLKP
jgi:hypothetical protein